MNVEKKLRKDAAKIFGASLEAADPAKAVARFVSVDGGCLKAGRQSYALAGFERILVIGAGKASATMAKALEKILGARITKGLVNTKYGHIEKLRRVELVECGHPVPDEAGIGGTRRICELAAEATDRDLVIALISGGASALMPLPAEGVSLAEKQATTKLLLACGATIHEINAVRKHISGVKGGQLARLAAPATVVSLMLSDVIGDSLDVIGSGPTAPDASTFEAAWGVIEKYGITRKVPAVVAKRLHSGMNGDLDETPKAGDPCFTKTQNLVIGSNKLAVDAAAAKAKDMGYRPLVLSTFIEGETRDIASMHAAIAKEIIASHRPVKAPACIISGGETTVTLRGGGLGGRNQEFALAAALVLDGVPGVVAFSGGTDGTDGPTDAAGAVSDGFTVRRAGKSGLNAQAYLAANDSYHFFEGLGDLIKTGPTGTNVMDVRLMLIA